MIAGPCATCRLRALLRHQLLARQRRQWISCGPPRRRDEQGGEYVDTLLEKFDRSLSQPRKPRRRQDVDQHKSSIGFDRGNGSAKGRYSGQPLQERQNGNLHSDRAEHRWHGEDGSTRGRYSGMVQQSQDMLQDLAVPHRQRQRTRPRDEQYQNSAVMLHEDDHGASTSPPEPQRGGRAPNYLQSHTRANMPADIVTAADEFLRDHANEDSITQSKSFQDIIKHAQSPIDIQKLGKDKYFGRAFFYWALKMIDAFVSPAVSGDPHLHGLPYPSTILNFHAIATQKDSSTLWPLMLWTMAQRAAVLRDEGHDDSHTAAERILQEVMVVWSLCMKMQHLKGRETTQPDSIDTLRSRPSVDFSFLPDATSFDQSLQERGTDYTLASILDYLVLPLSIISRQRDYDYSSAALVTLDLLQTSNVSVEGNCERWIALVEIINQRAADKTTARALFKAAAECENERAREYFKTLIDKFELRAPPVRPPSSDVGMQPGEGPQAQKNTLLESLDRPPALTESSSDFDRYVHDAIKNLGRALEQNKLVYAKRTWRGVQENSTTFPNATTPLLLYEHLLATFIALRDQQMVIEVWQAMKKDGHLPTVKTYSIIMQGCRYTGDVQTSEAFWASMRNVGLQPDGHAWSTRLFSLFKNRQIDAGFRALNEMSQEWITAARRAHERGMLTEGQNKKKTASQITSSELAQRYQGDIDGVTRPEINVVNTAVAALAAASDKDIPRVLSWAHSFSIEPDLRTYNALLNVTMRHGKADEAENILRRMEERGIQADGTTWTVLLTALFQGGFLDDLDQSEQQKRIMSFLSSISSRGSSTGSNIDAKGYALVIDRLLKQYSNVPAAEAVLKHMHECKIQPTPHIWTILMSSYFDPPSATGETHPPNFRAVEDLWNTIRTANSLHGAPLDSQFYDRMVEGYARHHVAYGSTKPVTFFLQRMQNEGKKPSWKALCCVVQAFAEKGEYDRARSVIATVKRNLMERGPGGQRFGQRDFWGLCVELGLIEWRDVPRIESRDGGRAR